MRRGGSRSTSRSCRSYSESERATNHCCVTVGSEGMTDMRCPGCGAEMHLIEVAPDKTKMVPGYEQHTFECSGCHDHVRQLVFIPRAIGPIPMTTHMALIGDAARTARAKSSPLGIVPLFIVSSHAAES